MLGNIHATTAGTHVVPTLNTAAPVAKDDASAATSASSSLPTISTLSRQLSDSAARAEARDSSLNHKQLGELAHKLDRQVAGERYFANKARHDSEVPKTDDPELLARARHATDYVNRAAKGDQAAKSPFAGLAREQLILIAHDDSGSYTVNERRAASYEARAIEHVWRQRVAAHAMAEYNRTGTAQTAAVLAEMLSQYESLPRIEQAQYPEGYAASLQSKIT